MGGRCVNEKEAYVINQVCIAIQCDHHELKDIDGHLIMTASVLDCDPEYYYEEYGIKQDGSMIAIDITALTDRWYK